MKAMKHEFFTIHVTNHSDGTKMEGIQSIGTSAIHNAICQYRIKNICGGICAKCYADRLLNLRKNLDTHLEENFRKLTSRLLTRAEAAAVPLCTVIARIESFGDAANVIQARNYLRIIKAHRGIRFGIWSKNWGIWLAAFKAEGKPRNCTYVHSSMRVNEPDVIDPRMEPYVDHVFTVWDKKHYAETTAANPVSECAGIRCMSCQKCYRKCRKNDKGNSYYINECLR